MLCRLADNAPGHGNYVLLMIGLGNLSNKTVTGFKFFKKFPHPFFWKENRQ